MGRVLLASFITGEIGRGETMFPPWAPFFVRCSTLGRREAALEQSSAPPANRSLSRFGV
jgi:hypothetical protein